MFKRSSNKQIANRYPIVSRCVMRCTIASKFHNHHASTLLFQNIKMDLARWLCRPVVKTSNSLKKQEFEQENMRFSSDASWDWQVPQQKQQPPRQATFQQSQFVPSSMRWLPWPCARHYPLAPPQLPIWKSDGNSLPAPIPNAPLQHSKSQHLQKLFALSLLSSRLFWVHECFFSEAFFSYNLMENPQDGNRKKVVKPHVEGDPYHDSSNPQSAEWFRWRHLQPVTSPVVRFQRKLIDEIWRNVKIWETPSILKKWHLLEEVDIELSNWIVIFIWNQNVFETR